MKSAKKPVGRLLVLASILIGSAMASKVQAQVGSYSQMARMQAQMRARHNSAMGQMARMQGQAASRNGAASGMIRQQHRTIVAELLGTRAILHRADHDYNGMRMRAIGQIDVALRHLGHRSTNPAAMNGGAGGNGQRRVSNVGNGNGGRMPQATSDAHLRQAIQRLQTIQQQMANLPNASRHPQAGASIQRAIADLNQALMIR